MVRKPGSALDEGTLLAYAREKLAGYKVPKSVAFMDSFPLVPSGKVSKVELRAPYWSGQTRSVG